MDHLIELRQRMIYALIGVAIGFAICFAFATDIYNLLVLPCVGARRRPEDRDDLHRPARVLLHQAEARPVRRLFLAFPLIAMQVYKFVAPGLYKNERQAFRPYLLWTFGLFIAGASVVYFIVMPLAMKFFLSMEQTGGQVEIHLQARVSEYLSLIMTLIIGFGIMFQLPVVLTLLAQAGIVSAQNLKDFRRYAIVAITAAAGVLSARSLQHDRHGAADHPALRGRHLRGDAGGEGAHRRRGRAHGAAGSGRLGPPRRGANPVGSTL